MPEDWSRAFFVRLHTKWLAEMKGEDPRVMAVFFAAMCVVDISGNIPGESPSEVSSALGMPEEWCSIALERLCDIGIAERHNDGWRLPWWTDAQLTKLNSTGRSRRNRYLRGRRRRTNDRLDDKPNPQGAPPTERDSALHRSHDKGEESDSSDHCIERAPSAVQHYVAREDGAETAVQHSVALDGGAKRAVQHCVPLEGRVQHSVALREVRGGDESDSKTSDSPDETQSPNSNIRGEQYQESLTLFPGAELGSAKRRSRKTRIKDERIARAREFFEWYEELRTSRLLAKDARAMRMNDSIKRAILRLLEHVRRSEGIDEDEAWGRMRSFAEIAIEEAENALRCGNDRAKRLVAWRRGAAAFRPSRYEAVMSMAEGDDASRRPGQRGARAARKNLDRWGRPLLDESD